MKRSTFLDRTPCNPLKVIICLGGICHRSKNLKSSAKCRLSVQESPWNSSPMQHLLNVHWDDNFRLSAFLPVSMTEVENLSTILYQVYVTDGSFRFIPLFPAMSNNNGTDARTSLVGATLTILANA